MSPEILAILTAAFWGIGGFFEKKGLIIGNLPPIVGIFIRTIVASAILGIAAYKKLPVLKQAGWKSIFLLVIFGGIMAGSLGMLFFYKAIKTGELSRVMPIAFTSPLFGAIMAILFAGEPLTLKKIAGLILTISGIALLTI